MIPFTAEEIWKAMKHTENEEVESVMLTDFPEPNDQYDNEEIHEKWDRIIKLKRYSCKRIRKC